MKKLSTITIFCSIILLTLLLQQNGESLLGETAAAAQEATNDTNTHLPLIMRPSPPQPPASLFGVQTYGSTDVTDPYHAYLIGSQASWVRTSVSWKATESENVSPADYNWAYADSATAIAHPDKGRLKLIVTIESLPSWAELNPGDSNGPIHPDALDDFAEFLTATVERYDGDGYHDVPGKPVIRHWELFNEPDNFDRRWGGYGTEYAEMLEVAYEAIKTADPGAQVLLGGLAYDWFDEQGGPFDSDFLDDVLSAGGGAHFDVMNFHTYPLFAPTWGSQSTGLKEKTAAIRAKLADYGLEKPIAITEAGWHNGPDFVPSSSDVEQIARLIQLATHAAAADVDVLIWFMIHDPGSYLPPYGLVTADNPPVPKSAYAAYQTAVSLLGEGDFVRELGVNETGTSAMEAYRFNSDGKPLYVAWMNPYGTAEVHALRIPATEATLLTGTGDVRAPDGINANPITDDDGDGYVEVNIIGQPIYIQVTP